MRMSKQTVSALHCARITGAQALIEGVIRLPEGMEAAASVLEALPQIEVNAVRVANGKVTLEGNAVFSILYIDVAGKIGAFDSMCAFSQDVENEELSENMTALPKVRVSDTSAKLADSSSFNVRCVFETDVDAVNNTDHEVVENIEEDAQVMQQKMEVPYLRSAGNNKLYMDAELRVPQSMPQCKEVLLSRAYSVVRNVYQEDGELTVEGDLRLLCVYLSQDKNAPLQFLSETVPFGQIITDDGFSENAEARAEAWVERVQTECTDQSEDLLHISAVISINFICTGRRAVNAVCDAYSRTMDYKTKTADIALTEVQDKGVQKKILRLPVQIPQTSPEVMRALIAYGTAEILSITRNQDRAIITGVLHVNMCYTTQDAGIRSIALQLPFEAEMDIKQFAPDSRIEANANAEYVNIEGSGRDMDCKCSLEFEMSEVRDEQARMLSEIEAEPAKQEYETGIIVYFADGKQTLWDIAKKFRVRTDELVTEGMVHNEVVEKGKRLVLVRN